jgi:rfaE bifunctional protein nucleotidyltransferase chain/domain
MGRVVHREEVKAIRAELRRERRKVVFTNGVFDILHRGHVEYLTKAHAAGDILIVGMNSDASVRRIKGEKRPVVPQDDRAYVLSNLVPVDYVCLFEEDTPYALIAEIVPDVLVKGADWSIDAIVGKDLVEQAGGVVATIEFVPDRSTTSIIDRILERFSSK